MNVAVGDTLSMIIFEACSRTCGGTFGSVAISIMVSVGLMNARLKVVTARQQGPVQLGDLGL